MALPHLLGPLERVGPRLVDVVARLLARLDLLPQLLLVLQLGLLLHRRAPRPLHPDLAEPEVVVRQLAPLEAADPRARPAGLLDLGLGELVALRVKQVRRRPRPRRVERQPHPVGVAVVLEEHALQRVELADDALPPTIVPLALDPLAEHRVPPHRRRRRRQPQPLVGRFLDQRRPIGVHKFAEAHQRVLRPLDADDVGLGPRALEPLPLPRHLHHVARLPRRLDQRHLEGLVARRLPRLQLGRPLHPRRPRKRRRLPARRPRPARAAAAAALHRLRLRRDRLARLLDVKLVEVVDVDPALPLHRLRLVV